MAKARIIVQGTTGTRPKYVQGTFLLRSEHSIYVRQTHDIRQHTLLERPINEYVRFSYAINSLKARCADDTDMIDKLIASKITNVLEVYMFFYHARRTSVLVCDACIAVYIASIALGAWKQTIEYSELNLSKLEKLSKNPIYTLASLLYPLMWHFFS